MKTKITDFLATDPLALTGFLFEPAENTNRIAIFLHGNGNSSALSSLSLSEEMINELHKEQCAYLTFNNRGAGYMAKLRNAEIGKKVWGGTAYEKIEECVADIDGAISFTASRGYTDITLVDLSSGANKACVCIATCIDPIRIHETRLVLEKALEGPVGISVHAEEEIQMSNFDDVLTF